MIRLFNIKKIVSVAIGIPAFMIFVGEAGPELFAWQLLAGAAIVGLLAWNGIIRRPYGRE